MDQPANTAAPDTDRVTSPCLTGLDSFRSAVLLGTRYHNWGPVPAEVRTEFLAGYQAVRPLTPAEAGWLDIVLLWQALAMVPPGDDPAGWGPSALSQLTRP